MESRVHKSALLTSSTKSDVLRSGGEVAITDLMKFRLSDMLAAEHLVQRDEVKQLVTIDIAALTFAASKTYTILAGNVRHGEGGGSSSLKKYSYTSPDDITGLTKEEITDALVAKINDQPGNFLLAAKTDADTFTIEDDAGYYPARPGIRVGPTQYKLVDSLVLGTGATIVITTAGVVGYGVGQRILDDKPVVDKMTGNLVSGEWDYPENNDAVAGQKYDGFYVTYGIDAAHNAVSGLHAKKILRQLVWVDNGKGTSVTNLAGWKAFRREFERLIYGQFAGEPSAIVEFWEKTAILSDNDGIGVPTNADTDENLIDIGDNQFRYICIGTTGDDPVGSDLTNGFNMQRGTETTAEGIEVSAEIGTLATQEFTVGKQECSFFAEIEITDVSGKSEFAVGFRKKAAYAALIDNYTDMAVFNIQAAGIINIETILNDAATTTTDTTETDWADAATHTLEVRVDKDGKVTYRLDDKEPIVVAAFTFDADDVIIPFIHLLSSADLAGNIFIKKWYSVPAILTRGV